MPNRQPIIDTFTVRPPPERPEQPLPKQFILMRPLPKQFVPMRQQQELHRTTYMQFTKAGKITVRPIRTYQGRISSSTNGCTVISALTVARHLNTNDGTVNYRQRHSLSISFIGSADRCWHKFDANWDWVITRSSSRPMCTITWSMPECCSRNTFAVPPAGTYWRMLTLVNSSNCWRRRRRPTIIRIIAMGRIIPKQRPEARMMSFFILQRWSLLYRQTGAPRVEVGFFLWHDVHYVFHFRWPKRCTFRKCTYISEMYSLYRVT